jgi:hypothetical protein
MGPRKSAGDMEIPPPGMVKILASTSGELVFLWREPTKNSDYLARLSKNSRYDVLSISACTKTLMTGGLALKKSSRLQQGYVIL